MRPWDLTSGSAKLRAAMRSLEEAVALAGDSWNDDTFRHFQQRFLAPLEPSVRTTLESLNRLEQVLDRALRECESYETR